MVSHTRLANAGPSGRRSLARGAARENISSAMTLSKGDAARAYVDADVVDDLVDDLVMLDK